MRLRAKSHSTANCSPASSQSPSRCCTAAIASPSTLSSSKTFCATEPSGMPSRRYAPSGGMRTLNRYEGSLGSYCGVTVSHSRCMPAIHARLNSRSRRRPVRHAERLAQVEHQLDVVLRQDLLVQERDAPARDPEALDDAREIRRRRRDQEFPLAERAREVLTVERQCGQGGHAVVVLRLAANLDLSRARKQTRGDGSLPLRRSCLTECASRKTATCVTFFSGTERRITRARLRRRQ